MSTNPLARHRSLDALRLHEADAPAAAPAGPLIRVDAAGRPIRSIERLRDPARSARLQRELDEAGRARARAAVSPGGGTAVPRPSASAKKTPRASIGSGPGAPFPPVLVERLVAATAASMARHADARALEAAAENARARQDTKSSWDRAFVSLGWR